MSITKKQLLSLILLLALLFVLPLALFLTKKRQEIRPRALQGKANFLLSTDSLKSTVGQNINVLVSMQLTDSALKVSGVDFMLLYTKDTLAVDNIVPEITIVNPNAAFTDAPIVTSGGAYPNGTVECPDTSADCKFNFLRVAEVSRKAGANLPGGTFSLAKIKFRSIGGGDATIKFPDDNKYLQIVGAEAGVGPSPGPTCLPIPSCVYNQSPCDITTYQAQMPYWCPPPVPSCFTRPYCLDNPPYCQIGSGPPWRWEWCPTGAPVPTITPGGPTLTPSPTITPGGPTLTPTPTVKPPTPTPTSKPNNCKKNLSTCGNNKDCCSGTCQKFFVSNGICVGSKPKK